MNRDALKRKPFDEVVRQFTTRPGHAIHRFVMASDYPAHPKLRPVNQGDKQQC